MSSEIDLKDLQEFNELVDTVLNDLESGKISRNPLAPQKAESVNAKDIVVKSTSTERGEDELIEKATVVKEEVYYDEDSKDFEATSCADLITDEDEEKVPETGQIRIEDRFFTIATDEDDIIGKRMSMLVVVTTAKEEEVIFGSAAIAAQETGLNPTTVRTRCSKDYIDKYNNTWSYRDGSKN